jgi:hypothetical protein
MPLMGRHHLAAGIDRGSLQENDLPATLGGAVRHAFLAERAVRGPATYIWSQKRTGGPRAMPRSIRRTSLLVESVEPRWLPSGAFPVLTSHTYDSVVAHVRQVVATLAETHNTGRAASSLESLAARIPFGRGQLAPAWISDLALYDPTVPGSGRAAERVLLATLKRDVGFGVAEHEFRVSGEDAALFSHKGLRAPQASQDSVRVANNTNLTIAVTVSLNNTGRSIPMTIRSGAPPALFDFGTATGNRMGISVRNANGSSPPPFSTGLDMPVGGYNGALFTVSVLGGFFTVGS